MPASAAGISTLHFNHGDLEIALHQHWSAMWHELVRLTAGSGIRLRLSGRPLMPRDMLMPLSCPWRTVQLPAEAELVQRLAALDICVADPADIAAVCSLAALRHLQIECPGYIDSRQLLRTEAAHQAPHWWQLSSLRTLRLIQVPPAAVFVPGTAARLQHLHSLHLNACCLPDGTLPAEMLRLQSLSRLELMQPPLRMLPDLRGLPALRKLLICGDHGWPNLHAVQAQCSAELKAVLLATPLGGAMGLTEAVLHGFDIPKQCAEAIERLPGLRVLALDYAISHSQGWRGKVKPAGMYVDVMAPVAKVKEKWPDEDW
jgi:hypothetical protein